MRADVAQPFLLAAKGVLEQELGGEVGRGQVKMERGDFEAGEITAVVGVTGALSGAVMYRMSEATALAIVGQMMSQEFTELGALARSGIGELGNVITGRAGVLLEKGRNLGRYRAADADRRPRRADEQPRYRAAGRPARDARGRHRPPDRAEEVVESRKSKVNSPQTVDCGP